MQTVYNIFGHNCILEFFVNGTSFYQITDKYIIEWAYKSINNLYLLLFTAQKGNNSFEKEEGGTHVRKINESKNSEITNIEIYRITICCSIGSYQKCVFYAIRK